jgi:hypothetical protein
MEERRAGAAGRGEGFPPRPKTGPVAAVSMNGDDYGMDLEFFAWLYVWVLGLMVACLIYEKWRSRHD